MNNLRMGAVIPVDQMTGEDDEETSVLREMLTEATEYLRGAEWCLRVRESYFGLGIGGVVAVFLFRIDPARGADEWLWVITGDLPTAHVVTDSAPDPISALEVYCRLMDEWVEAVQLKSDLEPVFPVAAPASKDNAALLSKRIALLREEVIPALK